MTKYFLRCLLFIALVAIAGCSTDFDITSDWKDITVVYGLLDYGDTAQYIKINKAFLDESRNALELAQIEDSVYYNSLQVRLEEYTEAGQQTNSITLEKIDGNLDGHTKPSGTFINQPNWLYKTTYTLNPDRTYKLVATKDDGNSITAQTKIVNNFIIIKPFAMQEILMKPGDNQMYVSSWKNAENASFYGLTIRFNYLEYPDNNPTDIAQKYFEWIVFTNEVPDNNNPGATVEYHVNSNSLYEQMALQVPVKPGYTRKAKTFDFTFAAGGAELYTYYLVSQAKTGITSGQITPDYTNVDGGKGLFSSRAFKSVNDLLPKNTTVDSIACNSLTKPLRFLNSQGVLCQ